MIDDCCRGDRCAHRAAIDIKCAQGYLLNEDEMNCRYGCSGRAYSCDGSVSLRDVVDFNRIFHEHVSAVT